MKDEREEEAIYAVDHSGRRNGIVSTNEVVCEREGEGEGGVPINHDDSMEEKRKRRVVLTVTRKELDGRQRQ
ncbi:hypothetical protein PRIPAC_75620 [Pristionchus pacificus]|uniref:Uncharacterized protein n=1 Tax=Pristionchus pacificus TaxID=54126 RepID=A0A2A6BEY4_PRIPA|nr:hypothetical protein PRIPAC_75620 [Pristionchus pacificus]|eukprot:PDM64442.1 hypothetical protein PRIPAC_52698 [Pristionchus pacificus]